GLTLCVLVPLQVVRFMPAGQPATVLSSAALDSRGEVLARYGAIVKHGDVLAQALPRGHRHGLNMLLQFAADPTAGVEPGGVPAEDVIRLWITGSFLPCEEVWVTAVTSRGTRIGPVRLANTAADVPADRFASRDELIQWLRSTRQGGANAVFEGALALPS